MILGKSYGDTVESQRSVYRFEHEDDLGGGEVVGNRVYAINSTSFSIDMINQPNRSLS